MRRASPPCRPRRRAVAAAALALAATLAPAAVPPAGAAHPFYEEQLRRGAAAFDRGEHAEAAEALRLASFGLLGEPPALTGALVRLALARRALGESAGAREAVERVLGLEERFGAYRAAGLPEPLRASFVELAAATVPAERLAGMPAFEELARRQLEDELAGLAPAARRQRLEELLAAEPADPRWPLLLGRLEMADGRFARAAELADRVLATTPESQPALCLRGLARAGAGDCAGAVADLALCDQSRSEVAVAITRLDCLAELGRWTEARDLAAALPPALRENRQVARLERRAEKNAPEAAPAPAAADAAAAETPAGGAAGAAAEAPAAGAAGAAAGAPPAAQPPPSGAPAATAPAPVSPTPPGPAPERPPDPALGAEDASRLATARAQLAAARTTEDLGEAWELASGVADCHPGSIEAQHLAAEIAYRSSRWAEAADYFRRGGEPERPERRFYYAVALYESGQAEAAAEVLSRALPGLRRTPFVERYAERILGAPTPP